MAQLLKFTSFHSPPPAGLLPQACKIEVLHREKPSFRWRGVGFFPSDSDSDNK